MGREFDLCTKPEKEKKRKEERRKEKKEEGKRKRKRRRGRPGRRQPGWDGRLVVLAGLPGRRHSAATVGLGGGM